MWRWSKHTRIRLRKNEAGSAAPIFGLCLMSIMAVVGATIALGMDTRAGQQLQVTADASALGGATVFLNHTSPKAQDRLMAAREEAERLATNNSNYELRDLNVDAVTEDAYGQHTRLAVELEFKPVNYFANFAGSNASAPMRRLAIAEATWGFPLCVLTLEQEKTGLVIKDQGELISDGCVIWSNSKGSESMAFEAGRAEAKAFCAAGDIQKDIKAQVSPAPESGCQSLPDPLKGFDVPLAGVCDKMETRVIKIGSTRLTPGIYCGGLEVKARNVKFEPGIYHVRAGGLKIDAHGVIDAAGVTFIFDGEIDKVEIKGNSGLNVIAPTEGPTAGIAFAELKGLLNKEKDMKVEGMLNVEGVIYMPSYDIVVKKTGGGRTRSPYLQVVANSLEVSDRGSLAIDFDMSKTDLPLVIEPRREARLVQ